MFRFFLGRYRSPSTTLFYMINAERTMNRQVLTGLVQLIRILPMNNNVKISTEGKPTLTKTLREAEAILRKGLPDTTVDLAIIHLEMCGRAIIKHRGVTITLTKEF